MNFLTYHGIHESVEQHPRFKIKPLIHNRPLLRILWVQTVVIRTIDRDQVDRYGVTVPHHKILIHQSRNGMLGIDLQNLTYKSESLPSSPPVPPTFLETSWTSVARLRGPPRCPGPWSRSALSCMGGSFERRRPWEPWPWCTISATTGATIHQNSILFCLALHPVAIETLAYNIGEPNGARRRSLKCWVVPRLVPL